MDRHLQVQSRPYRHAADDHRGNLESAPSGRSSRSTRSPGHPDVADGSFELVGSYSAAGGLVLNPEHWIEELADDQTVGLSASPPHANSMRFFVVRGRLLDLLGYQVAGTAGTFKDFGEKASGSCI